MPKRLLQILVLCLATFTMLGASDPGKRFDRLGHGLVCQCGCGQILLECNHVGCPVSPKMIAELQTQLATDLPDSGVLSFFISKYGPIVLAAPIRGGFDNVAWIVPFAVIILGIAAVILLLRLWKRRQAAQPPPASAPIDEALRERIRRDTTWGE